MTPIERELKTMLEQRASSYDARAALPGGVARRARTYRAATGAAAGAVVAAVVLAGMLGPRALTTAEPVRPAAPSPTPSPRVESVVIEESVGGGGGSDDGSPDGADPHHVVDDGSLRGRRWTLAIEPGRLGHCLRFDVPRLGYSTCGANDLDAGPTVTVSGPADVRHAGMAGVFGYASTDVVRVVVSTPSRRAARARLTPVGDQLAEPVQVWVAFVPRNQLVTVEAFDGDGVRLQRVRLPANPSGFAP